MSTAMPEPCDLGFRPLTVETWADFERLFGPHGCGRCWCMWWRTSRREFAEGQLNDGAGNREALHRLVDRGQEPGIMAYCQQRAIGWCSVCPREQLAALNRSRVLRPLDDEPVWSIVCFYVARDWRGMGVARALLDASVDHVRSRGGTFVEAYPSVPKGGRAPSGSSYMGTPRMFLEAGFVACAQPSPSKLVLRRRV